MFPMGMQHCFIFSRECEGGRCVYESYYILHMKLYLFFFGVFLTHFCFVFDWVCVYVCGGTCQHTQNCDQKKWRIYGFECKVICDSFACNSYDKWNGNERKAKVCRRKISLITWETKYRELSLWRYLFLNGLKHTHVCHCNWAMKEYLRLYFSGILISLSFWCCV